jgi:hypothetical protein
MPGEKYVIVDCERSMLLYSWRRITRHPSAFFKLTVTLKDKSLPSVLNRLSKDPNVSIIIVTDYPYTQWLEKHLKKELTETPFSIVYAPLLRDNKKIIAQDKKINTTPASISPPPGYTLLFNHTLSAPKGGWENYAEALWQRLVKTDYFCKLQERQELERQELEQREKERKKLKKREKEEKLSISSGEYSSSLRFLTQINAAASSPKTVGSPLAKISDETRTAMTLSPSSMRHIIDKTSSAYFKRRGETPPPCRLECIKREEAQNPSGSFRPYSPLTRLSSS